MMVKICIPNNECQKRPGSPGNVGVNLFVFTNVQADNNGTSSGDDEGNCVYNKTGRDAS